MRDVGLINTILDCSYVGVVVASHTRQIFACRMLFGDVNGLAPSTRPVECLGAVGSYAVM